MQNEERPKSIYDFTKVKHTYSFETDNQIEYDVIFRPTPYLFGAESLYSSFVYELIIRVAKNNSNKKDHDSEGIIYPVSLIVKYNNPHKKAIFWEFLEMIEGYNRNK